MTDQLIVVDDDQIFAQLLCRALRRRGFETFIANNLHQAKDIATNFHITHAVIDLRLRAENGLDLVHFIHSHQPTVRSIVLTGYGNLTTAVAAIKAGAAEFLSKPADADEIFAYLKPEIYDWAKFPGAKRSPDRVRLGHILEVYEQNDRNVSETARKLSMHRRTLQRILARYQAESHDHLPAVPASEFGKLRRLHKLRKKMMSS